jgi:hypothetical protein
MRVEEFTAFIDVDVRFISDRIGSNRGSDENVKMIINLINF